MILIACNLQAQQFVLTPTGFVSSEDNSKNYIVLDFPSKSKNELYNMTLIYITKNYKSAKDVISKVENEVLTINAVSSAPIRRNSFQIFQNNYTVVISFKDGKIKIDSPVVNLTRFNDGKIKTLHILWDKTIPLDESHVGVFGKDFKLKSKKALEDLEYFANDFLNRINEGLNNNDMIKEDW